MPALVSGQVRDLVRRLGDKATVDDPLFGRASGLAALERLLERESTWLVGRGAVFTTTAFTTGSDRDVTEGVLSFGSGESRRTAPIAVVAERRPEREVEVRIYASSTALDDPPLDPLDGRSADRKEVVSIRQDDLAVPPPVAAHLEALARADVGGIVANFESGATLRDTRGVVHPKEGAGGPLRAYYETLFGAKDPVRPTTDRVSPEAAPGVGVFKRGRADDGRTCALEYTIASTFGAPVPLEAKLAVYVRGESGLLRELRLY